MPPKCVDFDCLFQTEGLNVSSQVGKIVNLYEINKVLKSSMISWRLQCHKTENKDAFVRSEMFTLRDIWFSQDINSTNE